MTAFRRLIGAVAGGLALLALAACGSPAPAAGTAATGTAAPAASPSPAVLVAAATSPTAGPTVRAAAPTTAASATPGSAAAPATAPARAATATTAPAAAAAEAWNIEGRPVTQAVVAGERRFYVTTESGLYAVTGEAAERRAAGGDWPNLMLVNETTLLSGAAPACARGDGGAPLRRSTDGGRTWTPVQATGGRGAPAARPVPTLGNDLFALACDGLYRSTDSGASWARLPILGPDREPVDIATTPDGRRLYLVSLFGEGGTTRLEISERQNESWTTARTLQESWGGGIVTIGREQGRATVYFASPLGVQVSRDGGTTWAALNRGLDTTILLADPRGGPLPAAEEAKLRRSVGVYSIAPQSDRARVLLGGSDGLYALGGEGWTKTPLLAGQLVREVFYDLQGNAYARTDAGVSRLRGV